MNSFTLHTPTRLFFGSDQAQAFATIAEYAVKIYGDGKQLNALGALPVAEIISIFKATKSQSRA